MWVVSWLVYGVLCFFAEFISGRGYLIATGLACLYPAIADYFGATLTEQLQIWVLGSLLHAGILFLFRRQRRATANPSGPRVNIGDTVEVIEWLDECSARVRYRGEEWQADKVSDRMPDAPMATIQAVQGTRLVIVTAGPSNAAIAMPD